MKKLLLGMTCALALTAGVQAAERIPATPDMLSAQGLAATGKDVTLEEVHTRTLANGKTVTRYRQTHQGIPVWGQAVTRTSGRGQAAEVSGDVLTGLTVEVPSIQPYIKASNALERAMAHVINNRSQQGTVSGALSVPALKLAAKDARHQLSIHVDDQDRARLAYQVSWVEGGNESSQPSCFIDALTGEVLELRNTGVAAESTITPLGSYIDAYADIPIGPAFTGSPYCEAPAGSSCYYIAPNGSDSADGSIDSPLASINPIVSSLKAGDVVYLRGGEYTARNRGPVMRIYNSETPRHGMIYFKDLYGEPGKPILVRNYPNETPVINLYKLNPEFDPTAMTGEPRWAFMFKDTSHIRLSGVEVVNGSISVTSGTEHIYLDKNHIHDFLNNGSNTGLVRISDAHHVHLRDNILHDVYERKIKDENGDWVLNTTKSHYDPYHNGCVTTLSGDVYTGYGSSSTGPITMAGNDISNCPLALFFKNPQGQLVDANNLNSIIYGNKFHNSGTLAYYSISNSVFENNLVLNTSSGLYNTGKGEYPYASYDEEILNEISSRNITLKSNTFVGMNYIARFKGIGFQLSEGVYSEAVEDHFKFYDNVVVMDKARAPGSHSWSSPGFIFSNSYSGMTDQQQTPSKTLSKIVSKGNCYANSLGEGIGFMKQFIVDSEGGVDRILSYDHSISNSLFNINGSGDKFPASTSLEAIFKDPANGDYSLSENSPCLTGADDGGEPGDGGPDGGEPGVTAQILVSLNSDRSASSALQGASIALDSEIFIHVPDSEAINDVRFSLNGEFVQLEGLAPYDMGGTGTDGSAFPIDVSLLNVGQNTVSATLNNSPDQVLEASFHYGEKDPVQVKYSLSSDRSDSVELADASLSGDKPFYIFLEQPETGISRVEFILNGEPLIVERVAPYDMGGTADNGSAIAVDNSLLLEQNELLVKVFGDENLERSISFSLPLGVR